METLKTQFRMNELPYTLLKRNDVVALYGIGGTYTDEILHYEVDIIYFRKAKYGEREHIAKNDDLYWGIFYFEPQDSRVFVPKKMPYHQDSNSLL